jgi:hypothetical protein
VDVDIPDLVEIASDAQTISCAEAIIKPSRRDLAGIVQAGFCVLCAEPAYLTGQGYFGAAGSIESINCRCFGHKIPHSKLKLSLKDRLIFRLDKMNIPGHSADRRCSGISLISNDDIQPVGMAIASLQSGIHHVDKTRIH